MTFKLISRDLNLDPETGLFAMKTTSKGGIFMPPKAEIDDNICSQLRLVNTNYQFLQLTTAGERLRAMANGKQFGVNKRGKRTYIILSNFGLLFKVPKSANKKLRTYRLSNPCSINSENNRVLQQETLANYQQTRLLRVFM